MRSCPRMGGRDESVDTVWLGFEDVPILGALITAALAELRMPHPQIGVNPAPPAPQVVFVPTWLWVDSTIWKPQRATAAVPGLSVTAVAAPTKVTWETGDKAITVCDGPGVAWTHDNNPMDASTCGHTYTTTSRTSSGGKFTLRATVTWKITWAGGGFAGTEPAATTADETSIEVTEFLPVVTG